MIKTPGAAASSGSRCLLPTAAVLGLLFAGLAYARFIDDSAVFNSPSHVNGTCEGSSLLGTFVGYGDMEVFGLYFRWQTTQRFYANGTHDVDQIVLDDPLGAVPEVHCPGVSFSTSPANCSFRIVRDECLLAALNGLEIREEKNSYEPSLSVVDAVLLVQLPRFTTINLDLSYTLYKVDGVDTEA